MSLAGGDLRSSARFIIPFFFFFSVLAIMEVTEMRCGILNKMKHSRARCSKMVKILSLNLVLLQSISLTLLMDANI